jgi:hypothetical protein
MPTARVVPNRLKITIKTGVDGSLYSAPVATVTAGRGGDAGSGSAVAAYASSRDNRWSRR